MNYKLNKPNPTHSNGDGYITKDGHTMFNEDIVIELNDKTKTIEMLRKEVKTLKSGEYRMPL